MKARRTYVWMIATAALVGVAAGLGGVLLTELLHLVQHLAFGHPEDTFLVGVIRASPARRVGALTVGGLAVGLGWWALRSRGRPPTVGQEISALGSAATPDPSNRERPPEAASPSRTAGLAVGITAADAALQITAVGCGASLGREGAPRQLGAALAGWMAGRIRLPHDQRRTMIACGAGAGLAAVYNVPIGGALFALEILLRSAAMRDAVLALVASGVATVVAWPVLSTNPTYSFRLGSLPAQALVGLCVFALLLGPVAGALGVGFLRLMDRARSVAPSSVGWQIPVATTVAFAAVGGLSVYFPQVLGNGKGLTQLTFDGTPPEGSMGVGLLAALLLLKPIATAACLASGASGGLLTPALATGALLGALCGIGFSVAERALGLQVAPAGAFALVGAAAVLATTQRAPLCAIVLAIEFTHPGPAVVPALLLAVAGAVLSSRPLLRSASTGAGDRPG